MKNPERVSFDKIKAQSKINIPQKKLAKMRMESIFCKNMMKNKLLWGMIVIGLFQGIAMAKGEKNEVILMDSTNKDCDPKWGIGIVSRIGNRNRSAQMNYPETPVSVYNSPRGHKIGSLIERESSHPYYKLFLYKFKDQTKTIVKTDDLREINYEGTCLKYYKLVDGYANVLLRAHEGGVWLSVDEIKDKGYYPQNWMDFLLSKKHIYYPFIKDSLDIKLEPSIDSETVARIKGDLYKVTFTGKTQGKWAEVLVIKYDNHFCSGEKQTIIGKWKGWLQPLNKKGYPNIWFYTRGC